jgi:hypothetical protein
MLTHLAVCGDSFGTGEGLPDDVRYEKSFGGVVADRFDLPLKVYARSGCCNFTIYLQVKKIVEQVKSNTHYNPFVLITTTYHERMIIPIDDGFRYTRPDLADVEYLSYTPYWAAPGWIKRPMEFSPRTARLVTETVSNFQHFRSRGHTHLSKLFAKLREEKIRAIEEYYLHLFDTGIKKEQDDALFVTMHLMLKKAGIPHAIMGVALPAVIDVENILRFDWGKYSQAYPDNMGSGHCSEEGNKCAADQIIDHIKKYNLI